jgi:nucleoside-diphosphate-sugar epimerase
VKDTAEGFLAIAGCDETNGRDINIASNTEISLAETLNLIKKLMQSDVNFITDDQRLRPENSEVFRLWGDNKELTTHTAWQPEYNIRQGHTETIEWYIKPENHAKYKAGIYNL